MRHLRHPGSVQHVALVPLSFCTSLSLMIVLVFLSQYFIMGLDSFHTEFSVERWQENEGAKEIGGTACGMVSPAGLEGGVRWLAGDT